MNRTALARVRRRAPTIRTMSMLASCTLVLLVVNHYGLLAAARRNPSSRVNWIFQHDPTDYDVAILGSSLLKEATEVEQLSKETGRSVVQLAWGGRGISEQLLYLELFLERHHCETLLLELHPRALEDSAFTHPYDEFRYIPRLNNQIIAKNLQQEFGGFRTWVWRWVPMVAFAQFSTQIGWHDVLACRRNQAFDSNAPPDNHHGTTPDELRRQKANPMKQPDASQRSDKLRGSWLRLIELCAQKDVGIVAVEPPYYEGLLPSEQAAIAELVRALPSGTPIFQLAGAYLDRTDAFQDAHHLNHIGSEAFTTELASFLNSSH